MNQQVSLSIEPLKEFVAKHHAVIFISILGVLVAAAIFTLYGVIQEASAPTDDTTSTIATFDQKTIERIKDLHDSSDASSNVNFPEKRVNPFVE